MNTIEKTVAEIPPTVSPQISQSVCDRWDSLTKPRGSLGLLEQSVVRLAQIQNTTKPSMDRRSIYIFCGDHGIVEEGVSLYPSVVTREMVKNFLRGGAAINVLCHQLGIQTRIVDAGIIGGHIEGTIDRRISDGTRNFLHHRAMSRNQAEAAIVHGIDLAGEAAQSFDIVGLGEMGIGNTTAASAILCAFTNITPEESTGRGAGLDARGIHHKQQVVAQALVQHPVNVEDPLAVPAAFGGFEIAMMSGFMLGAAANRLPFVVDGFISGAAFLIARAFYPALADHAFFAHRSAEQAHRRLLTTVGAAPLLDLGLCLGEGTGAAFAIGLLTSAVSLYREMATFAEAAVSDIPKGETQTT